MRNLTHLALPLITSSEGYGISLVSVVLLLFTLLVLLSVSTTLMLWIPTTYYKQLFIIGLVVCVLLPCSTIHLLFVPFLLTVLVPNLALVIVNLIHRITLLLVI